MSITINTRSPIWYLHQNNADPSRYLHQYTRKVHLPHSKHYYKHPIYFLLCNTDLQVRMISITCVLVRLHLNTSSLIKHHTSTTPQIDALTRCRHPRLPLNIHELSWQRVSRHVSTTRKSSDNTIWRQMYAIQQMSHIVLPQFWGSRMFSKGEEDPHPWTTPSPTRDPTVQSSVFISKCNQACDILITYNLRTIVLIRLMTFHMRMYDVKCIIDANSAKCTYNFTKYYFTSMANIIFNISNFTRVATCHPPGIVHWDTKWIIKCEKNFIIQF